jgi:dienelactone hydrolase
MLPHSSSYPILIFMLLTLSTIPSSRANAQLQTQTIEYKLGDTVLEGYLAYDNSFKGLRPGILIVHEWTGIGDYVKSRAEQLAKLGYIAFAADIYGKGIRPKNAQEAGVQSGIYMANRPLMRDRVLAGLAELKKQKYVYPKRIAAIGYCFGGAVVLELARSGVDIAGVVTFHGALDNPNPEDDKNIKAKLLIQHGADDPFVNWEKVTAFRNEMAKTSVDWQFIAYSGAVHSFTNPASGNDPTKGAAYNAMADRRSWVAMITFFKEIFK